MPSECCLYAWLQAQCLLNLSGDAVVTRCDDSMPASSGSPQQAMDAMELISIPDSPRLPGTRPHSSDSRRKEALLYHVTELWVDIAMFFLHTCFVNLYIACCGKSIQFLCCWICIYIHVWKKQLHFAQLRIFFVASTIMIHYAHTTARDWTVGRAEHTYTYTWLTATQTEVYMNTINVSIYSHATSSNLQNRFALAAHEVVFGATNFLHQRWGA